MSSPIRFADFVASTADATPADPTDEVVAVRGGDTVRVTAQSIADLGGGGGGGDVWSSYGTPAWRYDFDDNAELADWDNLDGSKADLECRSGTLVNTVATAVTIKRDIANAPFIFDVGMYLGQPTGNNFQGMALEVVGNLSAGRRLRWGYENGGAGSPNFSTQQFVFQQRSGASWGGNIGVASPYGDNLFPQLGRMMVMRIWYDGTTYQVYWMFSPFVTIRTSGTWSQAKSSWNGDPLSVCLHFSAGVNDRVARIAFAQFQNSNLDRLAGM